MIILIVVLVVVVGGIIIAIFGWDRYRGGPKTPPGGPDAAQPTNEVFLDPDTGRRMRVWYDARTGQREYRLDEYPGAPPG
jgi:hypothetical protein